MSYCREHYRPTLTSRIVREQDPELLRQCRPVLLHRQRRQRPPGLWPRIRPGCSHFHQEQAQQRLWQRNDYYRQAYFDHNWLWQLTDYHCSIWRQLLGEVGTVRWSRVSGSDLSSCLLPLTKSLVGLGRPAVSLAAHARHRTSITRSVSSGT